MRRLVLCSQNAHKRDELEAALPGWRVELLDADGYPEESGETFEDNARGKAGYGRRVGPADAWVVGEDSGVELAALGGAPGVRSARWASGREAERALEALAGATDRRGRYVCALVAIAPDGSEVVARGELRGRVAQARAGSAGFGFDPVFVPEGETRTVAELGNAWKAVHSHRARAAALLRAALDPA